MLYHWKNHLKAIEGGAADARIRELRKQVRDLKRVLANSQIQRGRPLRRKVCAEVRDEFLGNGDLPNRVRGFWGLEFASPGGLLTRTSSVWCTVRRMQRRERCSQ